MTRLIVSFRAILIFVAFGIGLVASLALFAQYEVMP